MILSAIDKKDKFMISSEKLRNQKSVNNKNIQKNLLKRHMIDFNAKSNITVSFKKGINNKRKNRDKSTDKIKGTEIRM
jgi:hypothetical protein